MRLRETKEREKKMEQQTRIESNRDFEENGVKVLKGQIVILEKVIKTRYPEPDKLECRTLSGEKFTGFTTYFNMDGIKDPSRK